MDNQINRTLEAFGLTKNEVKVYREIVKHDETSPFEIARLTGIPRTTVYDIIMSLSLKGIIELRQNSGFEKQQTRIKAKNPSVLREIIRQKQQDLARLDVSVVDILAPLKGSYLKNEANADFMFYPGISGATEVLLKINKGNADVPLYAWNCLLPMDTFGRKTVNDAVANELKKKRETNLYVKNIIPLTDWTRHALSYQYSRNHDYITYNQFRFIESPIFKVNQEIYLRNDTISIVCADQDEAWGLRVRSKSLLITFMSIFELMWLQATPVTEQLVQTWLPNKFFVEEQKIKNSNKSRNVNIKP